MQLARERAITLHRRMWRWIGLKTLKEKRCVKDEEWFDRFRLEWIHDYSYCCEYGEQFCDPFYFSNAKCNFCPIDWGGENCMDKEYEGDGYGLFSAWRKAVDSGNWQEAAQLALYIAELPERERRLKMVNKVNIKLDGNECITINDDYKISIDADGNLVAHSAGKRTVKVIEEPEKRHTGIEEPEKGEDVYYIDYADVACKFAYSSGFEGDYQRGRVTTDEQLCSDRDRAAQIRFALEKYAAENNAEPLDWTDDNSWKYRIAYNSNTKMLEAYSCVFYKHDTVYFDSAKTAKNAIKAVGEEDVLWLYRDYQPYLNAFKMEV